MFEDVWHSGGIGRVSLEANREDIVRIISGNVQVISTSLVMLKMECRQLELWDLFDALERESMDLFSHFGKVGDVCHCRISSAGAVYWLQEGCLCGPSVAELPTSGAQHIRDER